MNKVWHKGNILADYFKFRVWHTKAIDLSLLYKWREAGKGKGWIHAFTKLICAKWNKNSVNHDLSSNTTKLLGSVRVMPLF